MKLARREVASLHRWGVVIPSYAFVFDNIPPPQQKRLLKMLESGVCTNVGQLEPAYTALTRHARVPALSVRKGVKYAWRAWVERPPKGFELAVRELQVADRTAYRLRAESTLNQYPHWAEYTPSDGTFNLVCMKDTAVLRRLAKEQWADTPEYKARIKALVAELQSGKAIWFS